MCIIDIYSTVRRERARGEGSEGGGDGGGEFVAYGQASCLSTFGKILIYYLESMNAKV